MKFGSVRIGDLMAAIPSVYKPTTTVPSVGVSPPSGFAPPKPSSFSELKPSPMIPDGHDVGNKKFPFGPVFQTKALAIVLRLPTVMQDYCDDLRAGYFEDPVHQNLFRLIQKYYKVYKVTPTEVALLELIREDTKQLGHNEDFVARLASLANEIATQTDLSDANYIQDRMVDFIKYRRAVEVTFKMVESLEKMQMSGNEDFQQVLPLIRELNAIGSKGGLGYSFYDNVSSLSDQLRDTDVYSAAAKVPTGFKTIDHILDGGLGAGEIGFIVAGAGIGKCFRKGTEVRMFDGSLKKVEDVVVGDAVMGPDSKPRTVLSLGRGREKMYEVRPVKGNSYFVNESHILSFVLSGKRYGDRVVNMSVSDFIKQNKRFKKHAKGYKVAVSYPSTSVRIDPYILGTWLGDGTSHNPDITSFDTEVVSAWEEEAKSRGLLFKDLKAVGRYSINSGVKGSNDSTFLNDLISYGLRDNKHIPVDYLINDRGVRLSLLAGIIDTDGHLHKSKSGYELSTVSEILAKGYEELALSLGFSCSVKLKNKRCQTGAVGQYYVLTIHGACEEIPVRIPRKKANPRKQVKDVLRSGISVIESEEEDYFGFAVDGDHLFLLRDFTVVHNSTLLLNVAVAAQQAGVNVLVVTMELKESDFALRCAQRLAGVTKEHVIYKSERYLARLPYVQDLGNKAKIVFKYYPPGRANVDTIRSYFSQLLVQEGNDGKWLVIIDYLEKMKLGDDRKSNREDWALIGDAVNELIAFGVEFNVPVFSASQVTRSGYAKVARSAGTKHTDKDDIGASWKKVEHADLILSFDQSEIEKAAGIARVRALKVRRGKDGMSFKVRDDRPIMNFVELDPDGNDINGYHPRRDIDNLVTLRPDWDNLTPYSDETMEGLIRPPAIDIELYRREQISSISREETKVELSDVVGAQRDRIAEMIKNGDVSMAALLTQRFKDE
jgi:replicative DNA helicase